jgi:geranylgeranyl reductase family protein
VEYGAQIDVGEVPARRFEVAVVGAGPAGAAAALCLARAGRSVLLVDRARFPREKVCGDGLLADAQRSLARLGLLERVRSRAHACSGVAVFSPARIGVEVDGAMLTLARAGLDDLLARGAAAAGAVFARGRVRDVAADGDGVRLRFADREELEAETCVLATGADVRLARGLGLAARRIPSALAVRRYYRSEAGPRRPVISFDRSILPGYAWIFPMGRSTYNVGCGVFLDGSIPGGAPRRMLSRFMDEFPIARELARAGSPVSAPGGAPLRCGLVDGPGGWSRGRVVAAGEAMGATLPFTGEGIGKAMQTGEMAAAAVHAALGAGEPGRLGAFGSRVDGELRPSYAGYAAAQRWLGRAWLADLVARRARRSAYLRASLAGVIDESADPRRVFSAGGVLRSLLA